MSVRSSSLQFLSHEELLNWSLRGQSFPRAMIIDTRSHKDYLSIGHVPNAMFAFFLRRFRLTHSLCSFFSNIPLADGESDLSNLVPSRMSKPDHKTWSTRNTVTSVLLVTEKSWAETSPEAQQSVNSLFALITPRQKRFVLEGGFQQFSQLFPMFLCKASEAEIASGDHECPSRSKLKVIQYPSAIIAPYLFIGNYVDAHSSERLKEIGITHILNVADDVEDKFPQVSLSSFLCCSIFLFRWFFLFKSSLLPLRCCAFICKHKQDFTYGPKIALPDRYTHPESPSPSPSPPSSSELKEERKAAVVVEGKELAEQLGIPVETADRLKQVYDFIDSVKQDPKSKLLCRMPSLVLLVLFFSALSFFSCLSFEGSLRKDSFLPFSLHIFACFANASRFSRSPFINHPKLKQIATTVFLERHPLWWCTCCLTA